MLKAPTRIQPTSLIKQLVYALLFACIVWIGLVLLSANLWGLRVNFTFRYLLPTLEIKELYTKTLPAIEFALGVYFGLSSVIAHGTTWLVRNRLSEFGLERKYATNFVVLITQAILLINFSTLQQLRYILLGIFLLNAAVFLWSVKAEKVTKVLDSN